MKVKLKDIFTMPSGELMVETRCETRASKFMAQRFSRHSIPAANLACFV